MTSFLGDLLPLLSGVVDLAFPRVCVHCGEHVDGRSGFRSLCWACSLSLGRVRGPSCTTCGHPLFGPDERDHFCEHCALVKPAHREARTLVLFRGPARSLLHELKYHQGLHVLTDIRTLAKEDSRLVAWAEGGILVPVPMHPRKRRERGYNQTELIARELLGAGVGGRVEQLLVRTTYGKSQTSFDRTTRMANLAHAFSPRPDVRPDPAKRYILVDDVFTTGSTLGRCARALRDAGAATVDVITFAHG